ncbi:uncharacterized protein LOC125863840 [Solanum stenotomum]|uniref:uncharacterized protein LOC125863840 n=1 Tax=Solanum stenotomum TaxID=172797 RepID=UPI0020D097F4|nr:uncharacterized protein LOC125863840 [Solanum stenotomum]
MPSEIEIVAERDDDEIEVTGESKNATEKERLVKKTEEGIYRRFITMLTQLSINVLLIEALDQISGCAKFMKDLATKKRVVNFENDERLQHCSAIATRSLVQKKEDPGAFNIPCDIGLLHFAKALCDLGASIYLMPLSIYKKLGLGATKPIVMRLLMDDRTVSIILGRPFLATGRALVDMESGQMKFRLNNEEVTFNICRCMKKESDLKYVSVVNHIVKRGSKVSIEESLGVDPLVAVIMNIEGDGIEDYDELVAALDRFEFHSKPKKLELDMKNRDSPPTKSSVEEAPQLELKALPSHLRYVFLGRDGTLPVILAANVNEVHIEALVSLLKRFKRAIGWTNWDSSRHLFS